MSIVLALMLIFPLLSIVAQVIFTDHAAPGAVPSLLIIAKWYVFWAVGVRLSLAGVRQIIQPRYTAETILGRSGADSLFFVRELGFANTAMGCVGLASLIAPSWVMPAAMASDLFAAGVLAICCFA
ncbi:MAG TPA: DUF6790 family protein [Steroidobacteraceae bacterium]|jgi:hypothetical protein|nr:DUF6790 family protein [Steroidobacteraceae bacterium]